MAAKVDEGIRQNLTKNKSLYIKALSWIFEKNYTHIKYKII